MNAAEFIQRVIPEATVEPWDTDRRDQPVSWLIYYQGRYLGLLVAPTNRVFSEADIERVRAKL